MPEGGGDGVEQTIASIHDAAKALESRDEELAEKVRSGDKVIDALDESLNEEAARVIALRAPTASDLRVVLSVMRMSANLERIGDLSKNMAKRTTVLAQMTQINGSTAALRRMAGAGRGSQTHHMRAA